MKSKIHEYVEKVKQGFDWQAGVKWTDDTGVLQRGEAPNAEDLHPLQEVQVQNNECPIKDVKGWKKVHASRTA